MFSRMFWLSYRQSSLKLINNISRNKLSFWLCVCLSCSCLFLPSTQGMHTNLAAKMAAINLMQVMNVALSHRVIYGQMQFCDRPSYLRSFVMIPHNFMSVFRHPACPQPNISIHFISFQCFFPIFLHSLVKWLQFFFVSYAQSKKTAVGTVCATLKGVKMQETYTKHENWISFSVWIFVLHSFSVMLLPEIGINSTEGKMENTCK